MQIYALRGVFLFALWMESAAIHLRDWAQRKKIQLFAEGEQAW